MKARTVRLNMLGLALAAVAISAPALAQDCEGEAKPGYTTLAIEIANVKPTRGQVAVTVYPNDRKRFLAPGGKLLRQRVRATSPLTASCFYLPAGTYAVAVYHDVNGNKDFDRTLAGMPAEGFGFSNDAPSRVGLPPLDAVRFRLKAGDPAIRINMRYFK